MASTLHQIGGPNGIYGWEWATDAFDHDVDNALLAAYHKTTLSESGAFRIAVDMGCGTGIRAASIASLGIFHRIIACDIGDRSEHINLRNAFLMTSDTVTGMLQVPVEFQKISIAELESSNFEDEVEFINVRRVLHFLSPCDFRKALKNIHAIASDQALVVLSFDYDPFYPNYLSDYLSLSSHVDPFDFYQGNSRRYGSYAPYATYRVLEVTSFMKDIGFEIIALDAGEGLRNFDKAECRIMARVFKKPECGKRSNRLQQFTQK